MTQAEKMVAFAKSKIGSKEYYDAKSGSNYCQRFVRYCGEAAGIYGSAASAAEARSKWKVSSSMTEIPLAAAVYFKGSSQYGHVGIYIGNNKFIHANGKSGVMEGTLSSNNLSASAKTMMFMGWGYQGGVKPTGAVTSNAVSSGTSAVSSTSTSTSKETKEITSVVVKSVSGSGGAYKFSGLRDVLTGEDSGVQLFIQNDKIYAPVVVGTLQLTRERGSPSVLTFEVVKDDILNFQEGNPVSMKVNGEKMFYGYVFTKQRSDNSSTIKVSCYDQLRYFKNKDTLSYANKTYSQLVKMIADDYNLVCGDLEDTGYVIGSRIEDGTLLDILGNASDLTVIHSGKLFVLYDDFGEICLKNIGSMISNVLIDEETAENFSYTSSIDDDTYNRIKLSRDNDETGEREVYIAQDGDTQRNWGVLQYYESESDSTGENLSERAELILKYYNQKRRKLTINNCMGNTAVRGGTLIPVQLSLGDIAVKNYMMVEKATHKFESGQHFMDLIVSGVRGEFVV